MGNNVVVIGAAGHVGLPFSLVLADEGYQVFGVDTNQELVDDINKNRRMPYQEAMGDHLLEKHLGKKFLLNTSLDMVTVADYIVIMIGTPKDEEGNPRLKYLLDLVARIKSYFDVEDPKPTIILRSTVAPGTTEIVERLFNHDQNFETQFEVAFCPERVAQGSSIIETRTLPQIVGVFERYRKFSEARSFFRFCESVVVMSPKEAEYAKLATNMYRYVNFALANELYMITRDQGVDIDTIINGANFDYPRMNMPRPGPAAGPCLGKDGEFLVGNVPFNGLISTAYRINEGLPAVLLNEALKQKPDARRLAIIGAGFKKNSEDTRSSLSFKLKKLAENKGIQVYVYDPLVYKNRIDIFDDVHESISKHAESYIAHCDIVIVMTPHATIKKDYYDGFSQGLKPMIDKENQVVIDIWNWLGDNNG